MSDYPSEIEMEELLKQEFEFTDDQIERMTYLDIIYYYKQYEIRKQTATTKGDADVSV